MWNHHHHHSHNHANQQHQHQNGSNYTSLVESLSGSSSPHSALFLASAGIPTIHYTTFKDDHLDYETPASSSSAACANPTSAASTSTPTTTNTTHSFVMYNNSVNHLALDEQNENSANKSVGSSNSSSSGDLDYNGSSSSNTSSNPSALNAPSLGVDYSSFIAADLIYSSNGHAVSAAKREQDNDEEIEEEEDLEDEEAATNKSNHIQEVNV